MGNFLYWTGMYALKAVFIAIVSMIGIFCGMALRKRKNKNQHKIADEK